VSEYDVGCARAIVHAGGVGVVVIRRTWSTALLVAMTTVNMAH